MICSVWENTLIITCMGLEKRNKNEIKIHAECKKKHFIHAKSTEGEQYMFTFYNSCIFETI